MRSVTALVSASPVVVWVSGDGGRPGGAAARNNDSKGARVKELSTGGGDNHGVVNGVYILYLVSLVVGVTAIVGLVMAYLYRDRYEPVLASHYTWQIRTFWIGVLFFFLGGLTAQLLIGVAILLATYVWWIIRCVKGLQWMSRNQSVPEPTSWLLG